MERELTPARGLDAVRAAFPLLSRQIDGVPIVYLDSAATSLKPQSVIDACTRYYTVIGANIHRGKHYLSEEASVEYERARQAASQLIGAYGDEVVFLRNATEGLNIIAHGLELSSSDVVLVSPDAHHSLLLPWRRKADVRMVRLDHNGEMDLDHFADLLRLRPKVVALNHCSNVTGAYAPVSMLGAMAKEAGALVVVDAAQSIPHRRVDVTELHADFLVFSAHKMLGPTGIGVLYGRREHLDALAPRDLGGGTVDWVDTAEHRLRKVPQRLEAGTPDIAGAFGLTAAIEYIEALGYAEISGHDRRMGALLREHAARRDYVAVLAAGAHDVGGIMSLEVRGCDDLKDLSRILSDSYGIMCRSGHLCAQPLVDALTAGEVLRVSAYVYNTEQEITRFFDALDEIHASIGG